MSAKLVAHPTEPLFKDTCIRYAILTWPALCPLGWALHMATCRRKEACGLLDANVRRATTGRKGDSLRLLQTIWAIAFCQSQKVTAMPNPSLHRTLHIKPHGIKEFKR